MNTAIFMLRCKELGFSVDELDQVDYGLVVDMLVEKGNDEHEYPIKADKSDFDRFMRS